MTPLTPEELADYHDLLARSSEPIPATPEIRGFGPRLWQGIKNIPSELGVEGGRIGNAISGLATGDLERLIQDQQEQQNIREASPIYRDPGAPRGWQEAAGDILPLAAKELALLYAPQTKLTAAGRALGLGPRAAAVTADVATGALSGLRTSPQEAGIQAGEFGAGSLANQLIPGAGLGSRIARAVAQAATPFAGSTIRGQDPWTEQNAVQGIVQGLFGALHTPEKTPLGPPRPTLEQQAAMERAAMEEAMIIGRPINRPGAPLEPSLMRRTQPTSLATEPMGMGLGPRVATEPELRPTMFEQVETVPSGYVPESSPLAAPPAPKEPMLRGPERPKLRQTPMDQGPLLKPKEKKTGFFMESAAPREKPRILSTAIQLPDGTVLKGEGFEGHPSIFTKAPPETDIEAIFNGAGFWGVDANGNERFFPREEALKTVLESGQLPPEKAKGVTKLTSEMMRGETFEDLIQNRPENANKISETETLFPPVRKEPGKSAGQMPTKEGGQGIPSRRQPEEATLENQIASQRDALVRQGQAMGHPSPEDFAQDTLLKAIGNKGKYDPAKGSVADWVAQTGRNLAVDQARAQQTQKRGAETVPLEEAGQTAVSPKGSVMSLLDELDPETRALVEEHIIGGKTQAELAAEKGVSQQAIQQKVQKGIGMMRTKATKGGFGSPETLSTIAGGAAGSIYGYATGDTPEERLNRALGFGFSGLLGGAMLPRVAGAARTLFGESSAPEPLPKTQTQSQTTGAPKPTTSKPPIGERISEWWNEKASKQFSGEEKTASGAVVRWLETMQLKPIADDLSKLFRNNRNISDNWNESIRGIIQDISGSIDKVTDADRAAVRDWSRISRDPQADQMLREKVSPAYAEAAIKMRDLVRELQTFVLKGEADPRKRALIESSLDDWRTRAFEAFEDPSFSPKQEDVAAWREYLKKNDPETYKGLPDELIDRNIREDVEAKRRTKAFNTMGANDRIAQLLFRHRKDLTPQQWGKIEGLANDPAIPPETQKILQDSLPNRDFTPELQDELRKLAASRKDPELTEMANKEVLPPEYRKVLGEINEPVRTLGLSAVKLVRSAAAGKLFSDILEIPGLRVTQSEYGAGIQKLKDAGQDPSAYMNQYVKAPDTASLGILGQTLSGEPTYIRRDVMDAVDAFNTQFDRNANVVWSALSKTASWQKKALTSWNPAGQARNWMTTPILSAIGGVYGKGSVESLKEGVRIALGKGPLAEEARKFGVTGVDFASSELKGKIQQATTAPPPPFKQELSKALKGDWKAGWNLLKRADSFAANAYAMPDNSVRAATWLQHIKGLQRLGMNEAEAKSAAADLVRRWTWDYSNQPRWVRVARNIPILNPFLTFQVEGFRVLKNLVQDAALVRKGWDKLTPLEQYRAKHGMVAAPAMLAYPAMVAALFESTLSDDERKKWNRTKQLMPSYLRYNYVAPMGMKDKDTFNYVGLQPYTISSVTPMIKAIMEGRPGDILKESGLVGLRAQPGIAALMDISQGRREIGGAPVRTPAEIAGRLTDTLLPAPLQSYNRQRLAESLTPNAQGGIGISNPRTGRTTSLPMFAANMAGVNVSQATPQAMLRARSMEKEEAKKDVRSRYSRILKSNAAPQVKQQAQRAMFDDLREIEQEFQEMFGQR